jgi:hypothetical protein
MAKPSKDQLELDVGIVRPTPSVGTTGLLTSDPWLAASALQKSIRRGDADTAVSAALALHRLRGSSIWQRFLVIAFEDIGAASPDTLVNVVTACTDPEWRRHAGGNTVIVGNLARMLARAPGDRSADYLISAARCHPSLAHARQRLQSLPVHARIDMAGDATLPLPVRATAAWFASGVEWSEERQVGPGDIAGLFARFRELGVPGELLRATQIAAQRTREPITIMLPVIWLAADADRHKHVIEQPVPASPVIDGVPLYSLDKHTRTGRRAIELFANENTAVRDYLDQHVPARSRRAAAYLCAFYADAAPLSRKLQWAQGDELERLGIEADFHPVGVIPDAIPALLRATRANLDHLNLIRERVLKEALRADRRGRPA